MFYLKINLKIIRKKEKKIKKVINCREKNIKQKKNYKI